MPAGEQRFDGNADFVGPSLPEAAPIVYYQKKRHIFGDLLIEIYDPQGKLVTTMQGDKRRGLNRVEWPERAKPPKLPPAAGLVENMFALLGPQVQEGTYTVKLIKAKETYTTTINLVPDPRTKSTAADRALQHKTVVQLYDMLGQLTYIVDATVDLRDQARQRASNASDSQTKAQVQKFADNLEEFRSSLVAVKEGGMITGEKKLRENLGELYGGVNGFSGRPTESQIERTAVLQKQLDDANAKFQSLTAQVPPLNAQLQNAKVAPLTVMSQEEWSKK